MALRSLDLWHMVCHDPLSLTAAAAPMIISTVGAGAAGGAAAGGTMAGLGSAAMGLGGLATTAIGAITGAKGQETAAQGQMIAAQGSELAAQGTIAGGAAARAAGLLKQKEYDFEATQTTQGASQDLAAAQRTALEAGDKTRLAISASRANAAGSGFNAGAGSAVVNEGQIAARGRYQSLMDMWNGESAVAAGTDKSRALRYSGTLAAFGGEQEDIAAQNAARGQMLTAQGQLLAAKGTRAAALGTLAGGAGSMFKQAGEAFYPRTFGGNRL